MASSNLSCLASPQNLISVNVPGVTQPVLQPALSLPISATGTAGAYFPIQSGQIITIPTQRVEGTTLTLPPVSSSAGYTFTVVCGASLLLGTLRITAPANTLRGFAMQKGASAADAYTDFVISAGAGSTTLTFALTALIGDKATLFCDGISWHVQAYSSVVTNATPTFAFT